MQKFQPGSLAQIGFTLAPSSDLEWNASEEVDGSAIFQTVSSEFVELYDTSDKLTYRIYGTLSASTATKNLIGQSAAEVNDSGLVSGTVTSFAAGKVVKGSFKPLVTISGLSKSISDFVDAMQSDPNRILFA